MYGVVESGVLDPMELTPLAQGKKCQLRTETGSRTLEILGLKIDSGPGTAFGVEMSRTL
jgi:hypothetical protein